MQAQGSGQENLQYIGNAGCKHANSHGEQCGALGGGILIASRQNLPGLCCEMSRHIAVEQIRLHDQEYRLD